MTEVDNPPLNILGQNKPEPNLETAQEHAFEVSPVDSGLRIDKFISNHLPEYSRNHLQELINSELVLLNLKPVRPKIKVRSGDHIHVSIPKPIPADWLAQALDLQVVYQDNDIMVINKEAGLVVHPGAGNPDRTLMNGVLHIDPNLRYLPRAGIVHRLDKDTSGLLVLARNEASRMHLTGQLKDRSMGRVYQAIIHGIPISGASIDQPIARSRHSRIKMAVTQQGKKAITHYRVIEKFTAHAQIEAKLETGRTHQIRVHLTWQGHPLIGDPLYNAKRKLISTLSSQLTAVVDDFPRQALHAKSLSIIHPKTLQPMTWHSPIPDDMQRLLAALRDG